jgi:hypothetical protein
MSISLKPSWIEGGFNRSTPPQTNHDSYRKERRELFWQEESRYTHYTPDEYEDFLEGTEWSEIHYWKRQDEMEQEYNRKQEFLTYPMTYLMNTNRNPRFPLYRVDIEYEDPWGWDNTDDTSDIDSDYESDNNQDDDEPDSDISE